MPELRKAIRPVVLLAALAALALPARAGAFVYWTNENVGTTIGRANLNGGDVNQRFIAGAGPEGVATAGTHVFYSNLNSGTIGRAGFDGSDPELDFIVGAAGAYGVAVGDGHVYWTGGYTKEIGRANLDGSEADSSFITGLDAPGGIAIGNGHIYWANEGTGSIGRANLDGSEVDPEFLSAPGVEGMAADEGHIYWTSFSNNSIGRANPNGTAEPFFISELDNVQAVAVDANHIYWAETAPGTIGRASLDGSDVDENFITGADGPLGVAVNSLPHASATTVDCAPSPLVLPAAASCTVTVTDTGPFASEPGPIAPTGTVSLSSDPAGGLGPGATSCVLQPAGAGSASCDLAYAPAQAGDAKLAAAYGGDATHGASEGSAALTVDPAPAGTPAPPSNAFKLGKPKLNRRKGTATIAVTLPGPGKLVLAGKGIKKVAKPVARAGIAKLTVRPGRKAKRKLARAGKDRIKLTVTFTPSGGAAASRSERVTLRLGSYI